MKLLTHKWLMLIFLLFVWIATVFLFLVINIIAALVLLHADDNYNKYTNESLWQTKMDWVPAAIVSILTLVLLLRWWTSNYRSRT